MPTRRGVLSWARPGVRTARLFGPLRNDRIAFAFAQKRNFVYTPRPRRFAMHGIAWPAIRKRRQLRSAGRTGNYAQKDKRKCFHVLSPFMPTSSSRPETP